jgi:hypothetical protein
VGGGLCLCESYIPSERAERESEDGLSGGPSDSEV